MHAADGGRGTQSLKMESLGGGGVDRRTSQQHTQTQRDAKCFAIHLSPL